MTDDLSDPGRMAGIALAVHGRPAANPAPPPVHGRPRVAVETPEGRMVFVLHAEAAPLSAANFLAYAEAGLLDGQSLFRIVTPGNEAGPVAHRIKALHWGWLPKDEADAQPFPNIPLERTSRTGLTHRRGTLSMARYHEGCSGPSFFVCVEDDPEFDDGGRRHPDGHGFAAFGQLVEGDAVIDRLYAHAEPQPWLRRRVPILSARRIG